MLWVSLYDDWTLQTVQAAIGLIIHLLCLGGTYVLVRYFWTRAARHVINDKNISAYDLLSLNGMGDTFDIARFLKVELLQPRYRGLLYQCMGIVFFTTISLLADFIASWTTQHGTVLRSKETSGVLAQRSRNSAEWMTVELNNTIETLKRAGAPQDQLLEFWPGTEDWVYNPGQWNSSWSMSCEHIRSTSVPSLETTGNCTGSIVDEFKPLVADFHDWTDPNTTFFDFNAYSWPSNDPNTVDELVTMHGMAWLIMDDAHSLWTKLQTRTRLFYLLGAPVHTNESCYLGKGSIANAFYTGTTCTFIRDLTNKPLEELSFWGANPDNATMFKEVELIGQHFGDQWALAVTIGHEGPVFEGEDIALFYQAYQVTKDTNAGRLTATNSTTRSSQEGGIFIGNSRVLDVRVKVPQVSLPCLLICAIEAAIIIAALIRYHVFTARNKKRLGQIPQTKLDWMLQTLRQEGSGSIELVEPATTGEYHQTGTSNEYKAGTQVQYTALPDPHTSYQSVSRFDSLNGRSPH